MPSSHLILGRPLLLLTPIPPSIKVFSSESTLHMRWPKYWSFSFSITPSKEIPRLIFRMDWLDLLAVQGTLKSLLQHHSSNAPILWRSAFFTVQLSHPYTDISKERCENGILQFPCTLVPFLEYPLPINDATISVIVQAYSPQIMNRYCHTYCIHLFS